MALIYQRDDAVSRESRAIMEAISSWTIREIRSRKTFAVMVHRDSVHTLEQGVCCRDTVDQKDAPGRADLNLREKGG